MIWLAGLVALFLWWFSTGLILLAVRWADRRGGGAHAMLVAAGLPVMGLGLALVHGSLADASLRGVYTGFLGALAIWGWIELAFLAGVIAGPSRDAAAQGGTGQSRFARAFATVAHHELALVLGLLGLVILSDGAANRMAVATYMVLFLARICAKLNLFFGVPRINFEFLPARLAHLRSHMRRGPLTPAFPIAITVLTALLAVCAERLWTAQAGPVAAGFALLTALSALALIEHWLMVVPLPDAKLWRWMLPAPPPINDQESKTHGL